MSIIDRIRTQFPYPRAAQDLHSPCPDGKRYCVGGAIALSIIGDSSRVAFPNWGELASVLRRANPALDSQTAYRFAKRITRSNDRELFDHAWHVAEQALSYGERLCGQCGSVQPEGQSCLCVDNHCQ